MIEISLQEIVVFCGALGAAGVATGLLAGVFGVGGGTVVVPVPYHVFAMLDVPEEVRMHLAVGTSLAVIVPTSIQSFRTHHAKGAVMMEVWRAWIIPMLAGVVMGSVIAAFASALVLKLVFIIIAGFNAFKLLAGREGWRFSDRLPGPVVMRVYGVLIGLVSSLMGIGGGILSTLVLTLYGQSIHRAVATSAGVGVLISVPGALGYMAAGWGKAALLPPFSVGFVSLLGFALIAPLETLAAPYGARLAHRLPKRRLEIAFGAFLLLVCVRFVAGMF